MKCIGDCRYSKSGKCTNEKSLRNNRCMIEETEMKDNIESFKTWMQQAMEHVEPVIREKLQEAISNYLEGEKVKGKTIKVRCINTLNFKDLTIDKEYPVIEEEPQGYKIINDNESIRRYHKSLFEKVEDVLMVECIDNEGYEESLMLNKKYPVLEEDEFNYFVEDEIYKTKTGYLKTRFKPVEQQKEYSVMELLEFPEGTQFKYDEGVVEIVEFEEGNKGIEVCEGSELILSTAWKNTKFTKVEQAIINHMKTFKELTGKEPLNHEEAKKEIVCYQKECSSNKGNKCNDKLVNMQSSLTGCPIRTTHTSSYAEEQLEYAKEKCITCYRKECSGNKENKCTVKDRICVSRLEKPINYEEEYKKLKKENEELRKEDLNKEIRLNNQGKRISTDGNQIQKLFQEIEKQKADNEKLRQANATNYDEYKESREMLKEENKKILIENAALQELKASYEDSMETMNDLAIERKKQIEELERANKGINNTRELIHEEMIKLANENERLKKEIEENNQVIENEYEIKLFLAEQEAKKIIEELERENLGLKDKLEIIDDEYQEEIKILKEKPTIANNYEAEINKLRCQLEELKKANIFLNNTNGELQQKITKLNEDLKNKDHIIEKAAKSIKTLADML